MTALQVLAELRQAALTARAALLAAKGGAGAQRAAQQLAVAATLRVLKGKAGDLASRGLEAAEALAGLGLAAASPDQALVQLQAARTLAVALEDSARLATLDRALATVRRVLRLEREARVVMGEVQALLKDVGDLLAQLS